MKALSSLMGKSRGIPNVFNVNLTVKNLSRADLVQISIVLHDSVPLINKPLRHNGIGQLDYSFSFSMSSNSQLATLRASLTIDS